SISLIKKSVEFFTRQLYFILAIGMIACLLITSFFLNAVIGKNLIKSEFEVFSASWAAFAFCSSGLAEIFLPVVSKSLIFVRASFLFSIVAHSGPVLLSIAKDRKLYSFLRRP